MMNEMYKQQVRILLAIIPEVSKEACFALHGGTAINLFVRNMPRLSVDIDLTYLPLETDYETSRQQINDALSRIRANILRAVPGVKVAHTEQNAKLLISARGAQVKVEVNLAGRGTIHPPRQMNLCEKAQETFDAFVSMQVVSHGQLFGGKICAALDRQHPRDLFDVKYLLANEGSARMFA